MRYIGVAKIFDWVEGQTANYIHAMSSSEIFEERYHKIEDQNLGPGLACNLDCDFAKREGL